MVLGIQESKRHLSGLNALGIKPMVEAITEESQVAAENQDDVDASSQTGV